MIPRSITWHFTRVPRDREPYVQDEVPTWHGPIKEPRTGEWLTSHVMNQDFVAWVGQGTLADRTQEHLGESDRGIILMRKRMLEEAEKVKRDGGDPKGTIRDPKTARFVQLPIIGRDFFLAGYSLRDVAEGRAGGVRYPRHFIFQAGQPEAITQAYREASRCGHEPQPGLARSWKPVGELAWGHALAVGGDHDRRAVFVGPADHEDVVALQTVIAGKDVRWHARPGDVAEVARPAGVGPGDGNEDLLRRFRHRRQLLPRLGEGSR